MTDVWFICDLIQTVNIVPHFPVLRFRTAYWARANPSSSPVQVGLQQCKLTACILINILLYIYFAGESGGEELSLARLSVCVSMCLSLCVCPQGYVRDTREIFSKFLYMLPMAVARSSSGRWQISKGNRQFWGFPPHWQCVIKRSLQKAESIGRKGGDVSAQRGLWLHCLMDHCRCGY